DFLFPFPETNVEAIVTNPPFALAEEFIELALERAPMVVMLLRLAFLESERRSRILDGGMLARVLVFANRLPMMHRARLGERKNASSAMSIAWYILKRNQVGTAILERIRWEHALSHGMDRQVR